MTQYMILIYESEAGYATAPPDVWQTAMEAHGRFAEQVGAQGGKILGGDALQPTATATSIRGDVVTDGPFAETKEALGGFYLIEARDLDHALAIAQALPGAVRRRRGPPDHGHLRRPRRPDAEHGSPDRTGRLSGHRRGWGTGPGRRTRGLR